MCHAAALHVVFFWVTLPAALSVICEPGFLGQSQEHFLTPRVLLPSSRTSEPDSLKGLLWGLRSELFEMLAPLEERTRPLTTAARAALAASKGPDALEPWNLSYALSGAP